MWQSKIIIWFSTTTVPIVTKLGRMLTLHKRWDFPWRIFSVNVTKSAVSCGLVTFTEEIQNRKRHFFWPNVTYLERLAPIKLLYPFLRGLARSRENIKSLYVHYHSIYSHQTCQVGDFFEGFLTYSHDF